MLSEVPLNLISAGSDICEHYPAAADHILGGSHFSYRLGRGILVDLFFEEHRNPSLEREPGYNHPLTNT